MMEHVPALRSVTRSSDWLRLLGACRSIGVVEAKLTGSSELDCAAITKGDNPRIRFGIASNEIVWALAILKVNWLSQRRRLCLSRRPAACGWCRGALTC